MSARRLAALVLASAFLTAACDAGGPAPTPPSTSTTGPTTSPAPTTATSPPSTTQPTTAPPPAAHYGYTVTASEWIRTEAVQAWDGTGALGELDLTVDRLEGPEGALAFAAAAPTDATLEEFVDAYRTADATVHTCPAEPEQTSSVTVGGEPATLDEMHCPSPDGAYGIDAIVIHDGTAFVFFTFTNVPGAEEFTRGWFRGLLSDVSFEA